MRLTWGLLCGSCGLMGQEPWRELNDKGKQLWAAGQCREAVPLLIRARALAPETMAGAATVASNLGAAYLCLGLYTRGEEAFRDALQVLEPGGSAGLRATVLNNLGVLLTRVSHWKEARVALEEGLTLSERTFGADHWMTATAAHSLGALRLRTGEYQQARELFRRALAIFEERMREHVNTANAASNLAVAELYLRDYHAALVHTAHALEMRRKLLPAKHHDVGVSLFNHAVALEKAGDRRLSKAAFREARSIRASWAAENLEGLTVDRKMLQKR